MVQITDPNRRLDRYLQPVAELLGPTGLGEDDPTELLFLVQDHPRRETASDAVEHLRRLVDVRYPATLDAPFVDLINGEIQHILRLYLANRWTKGLAPAAQRAAFIDLDDLAATLRARSETLR